MRTLPLFLSSLLLACVAEGPTAAPAPAPPLDIVAVDAVDVAPEPAPDPGPHADRLLAAVADYQSWGRVDELPNIAPGLCRMPTWPHDYGQASHARQTADHDQGEKKLYYLFAQDRRYRALEHFPDLGVGFTIVKQSWSTTRERPDSTAVPKSTHLGATPAPVTYAMNRTGRPLFASEPRDLFVMMKVGDDVPDSDDGWVYGVLTPDGSTVKASGALEHCSGCHQKAPHGRLFGLQPTETLWLPPKPSFDAGGALPLDLQINPAPGG